MGVSSCGVEGRYLFPDESLCGVRPYLQIGVYCNYEVVYGLDGLNELTELYGLDSKCGRRSTGSTVICIPLAGPWLPLDAV